MHEECNCSCINCQSELHDYCIAEMVCGNQEREEEPPSYISQKEDMD